MTKKTPSLEGASQSTTVQEAGFPVPFTEKEFQHDVLTLYVHQMRKMGWMLNENDITKIWQLAGKTPESTESPSDIYGAEFTVDVLGFTYADIAETNFAKCLVNMYQYAYYGILAESFEPMEYETIYTWISAILCDMNRSMFMVEWESYGGDGSASAARCFTVAELANARKVLEGSPNFSYFYGTNSKDDDSTSHDGDLTVHQMALLAGMAEMSIRAAANPKRANPLLTQSEEGRTRISIKEAKTWLQSKGRYVPITRQWEGGDIDLAKRKFADLWDLRTIVHQRRFFLEEKNQSGEKLLKQSSYHAIGHDVLEETALSNADYVRDLAKTLEFPADLFVLRVREVLAKEELTAIERELRVIAQQSN